MLNRLDCEVRGEGAPLLMLHGWGMHSGVWGGFADQLARRHQLHLVDLPGHGHSIGVEAAWGLAPLAAAVLAVAPPRCHWLGWSLGGMVALQAALDAPERIASLTLIATTPRFGRADDWPHAVEAVAIESLERQLAGDYRATLRQFLTLQLRGGEGERDGLRRLRGALFARGEPDRAALAGGLALLARSDLRRSLTAIRQPALVIAGGRDRLTHPVAARYLADRLSNCRLVELADAAHAPFLSHTGPALAAVESLLCDNGP